MLATINYEIYYIFFHKLKIFAKKLVITIIVPLSKIWKSLLSGSVLALEITIVNSSVVYGSVSIWLKRCYVLLSNKKDIKKTVVGSTAQLNLGNLKREK